VGIDLQYPAMVELFRSMAVQHPERRFTIFLTAEDPQKKQITYGELYYHARAIGGLLQYIEVSNQRQLSPSNGEHGLP
jgi:acyl-CoA synthetase (AMP-forming)/AMP-acid ligase II